MKTMLVLYILGFVSIIVLYVHDHRSPEAQGHFDLREAVRQMRRLEPAPDEFETEGTPGSPEPVTVVPRAGGESPKGTPVQASRETEKPLPNTFEGLDEKIRTLSEKAKTNPDHYIDIAECYNVKASMYLVRMVKLEILEKDAQPRFRRELQQERGVLEGRRIRSLWQAIAILNKAPKNVYEDTDVRWLKAMIYIDLPDQYPLAMAELRKLADDSEAIPALRKQARMKIQQYESMLGQ